MKPKVELMSAKGFCRRELSHIPRVGETIIDPAIGEGKVREVINMTYANLVRVIVDDSMSG